MSSGEPNEAPSGGNSIVSSEEIYRNGLTMQHRISTTMVVGGHRSTQVNLREKEKKQSVDGLDKFVQRKKSDEVYDQSIGPKALRYSSLNTFESS